MAIDGKKILVLAPKHNTGTKKDATGAFQPEAAAFAKRNGVPKAQVVWIDNHLSKRAMRAAVLAEIEKVKKENGPLAAIACFCHGWKTGIQFGFDKSTVGWLAQALAGARDVRVPLYACSTAQGADGDDSTAVGGDGGFADLLRDALCQAGAVDCQVDAHTTAGHTSKNPFVRRFQGMGSPSGGAGGFFIVSPSQRQLFAKWRKLLASADLRYAFPFMTVAEIHVAIGE
jgi:hypothetical protein